MCGSCEAKIYIGCVSKMGETRVSCLAVSTGNQKKTKKYNQNPRWALSLVGCLAWIRPNTKERRNMSPCGVLFVFKWPKRWVGPT